jgi:hypothetical protein
VVLVLYEEQAIYHKKCNFYTTLYIALIINYQPLILFRMDNAHCLHNSQHKPSQEQDLPSGINSLPELTEDVELLLKKLQQLELDVDQRTLQNVLEYARKA